jgi:hypothetical protein
MEPDTVCGEMVETSHFSNKSGVEIQGDLGTGSRICSDQHCGLDYRAWPSQGFSEASPRYLEVLELFGPRNPESNLRNSDPLLKNFPGHLNLRITMEETRDGVGLFTG